MKFRFIALTASVIVMAACTEGTQMPVAPDEARMDATPASSGTVQSVSGNADIDTEDGLRNMTIQARRSADGIVSGKLTVRQQWGNKDVLDADVSCFTIVANRAYVGAVLKAVNGEPLTDYVSVRLLVVDNGEESGAALDQSSRLLLGLTPEELAIPIPPTAQPSTFCGIAARTFPMYDLVRGNVQVRP